MFSLFALTLKAILVEENYYQNMYERFYDANEIDHINFRWLQLLILTLYSKNNCIVLLPKQIDFE